MLALLTTLRDALQADESLSAWADDHGQPQPRIVIGYKKPARAEEWPFVALLCSGDRRGFGNDRSGSLFITVVCGVRSQDADRDGSGGYAALAELDLAVLAVVGAGGSVAAKWCAAPKQTRLVDVDLAHPNYQCERAIEFTARF